MANPSPQRAADATRVAQLALLGIGTLATGTLGIFSLAAGYKYKKAHAADPSKVTVSSYIDDLTHLIPPWATGTDTGTDASSSTAAAASATSDAGGRVYVGGMDRGGFRSKSPLSPAAQERAQQERAAELLRMEALNQAEEAALTLTFSPAAFARVNTATPSFPLSADLLFRVATFLPYERVCALTRVNRSFRDFANTLLADPAFAYQQACSRAGFSEQARGDIWMRCSGARSLAVSMGQRASPTCQTNFYEHLVRETQVYREQLIAQRGLGNRSPAPPQPSSAASSSLSLSSAVDLSEISEEARSALDTILKDVPRTLVPSNAASSSLIVNMGDGVAHSAASASPSSASAEALRISARDELIHKLSNVLSVYCVHDAELGYTQGLNFVAVFLLQKLPEQDAYWLLYKVMQDQSWNLRSFFLNDLHGLMVAKRQFATLFQLYLPELHAHFQKQDVHSDIFTEWFMTFFTFSSFPRRYATLDRLWDLMLTARGTKMLFRLALSILSLAQETLLSLEFEEIIFYVKHLPDEGILDPDVLLPLMTDRFKVSNAALKEIERAYEAEEAAEAKRRSEKQQGQQRVQNA